MLKLTSNELRIHRRKIASASPKKFAQIYMTNNCNDPFSKMHEELFDALLKITKKRKVKLAIAAPRGHAKSTIISLVYVLWCVLYQKERLVLIASNTQGQAENLLKDIRDQILYNPLIVEDFPEISKGKRPKPWRTNKIQLPNGTMIVVYGAGQNPRGIRHDKDRPGLIICDDLENEEQAESEEQRDKLHSWFTKNLLNTGHPQTNVIVIGTVLHQDSILAQLIDPDRSPGWKSRKYKAVIEFSSDPQLWEKWASIFKSLVDFEGEYGEEAAKSFFESNQQQMLEGTKVLWPQRESYYYLMEIRETEGERSFRSEKQNEPMDPRLCIFKEEDFIFWDDEYKDVQHLIQTIDSDAEFYGACDPSMAKTKKGDYTAIVIILRNYRTKINYVIAADIMHLAPNATIETITEYAKIYKFEEFAIETNNFQQLLVDDLERHISKCGKRLSLYEINSSSNKRSQIATLETYIKQGLLRFSRKHRLLLNQLTQFPLAKNDDGPDALEMAMQIAQRSRPTMVSFEF